jgi:hypothetical protein
MTILSAAASPPWGPSVSSLFDDPSAAPPLDVPSVSPDPGVTAGSAEQDTSGTSSSKASTISTILFFTVSSSHRSKGRIGFFLLYEEESANVTFALSFQL